MSTASLGGAKIFGEVRVNLKMKFPTLDGETIEVRAKPHKVLSQVVQHVLQKLQGKFVFDDVKYQCLYFILSVILKYRLLLTK